MAKKRRTPPPPRRVQAPRRREDERSPEDRRKLLLLVAFAALGVVALAAVIAVLALTGGGGGGGEVDATAVRAAMRAAGCTYTEAKAKSLPSGAVHVATIDTKVQWNTYPPAAGPHYGQTAVWGFYDEAAESIRIVHNEEHGGVILWWGPDTPSSGVAKLRSFYNESSESMLGTPIGTIDGKSLGSKVAITACTVNDKANTE